MGPMKISNTYGFSYHFLSDKNNYISENMVSELSICSGSTINMDHGQIIFRF